jgi:hypothetical protein
LNICSQFPLEELARQNGVKPVPKLVAAKVAELETTPEDRKAAYQGCLDAIKQNQAANPGG